MRMVTHPPVHHLLLLVHVMSETQLGSALDCWMGRYGISLSKVRIRVRVRYEGEVQG